MGKIHFTAKYLHQILNYNMETGIFLWKSPRPKINVGDVAGCVAAKGHIAIKIDGKSYKAHRLAWLYVTGSWPKDQIDHKNRIPDDNRFKNLRDCNNATNCQNQGIRSNNKSGFQGVYWSKTHCKWQSSISVHMKRIHIGFFDDVEKAGAAYLEAKMTFHKSPR